MGETIVSLDNISKRYPNTQKDALTNVDFDIKRGERIGIVGLNGAGKSTLLKIIMGILQPSSGKVEVFGTNPMDSRKTLAQKLGVVFGQRTQLQWDIPVMDSYELLGAIFKSKNIKDTITEYEKTFNLENILKKPVRSLSLGQKMIAEYVGVMLHDPQLLILDEPTIGLDLAIKKEVIKSIQNLDRDKTVIFTSHILEDIYEVCDRVIIINQGEKVIDMSMHDIDRTQTPYKIILTLNDDIFISDAELPVTRAGAGVFEFEIEEISSVPIILNKVAKNNQILNLEIKSEKLERLIDSVRKE